MTRDLGMRSSKKAAFCALTTYDATTVCSNFGGVKYGKRTSKKRGCKQAFSTSWALQSPEQRNSVKIGVKRKGSIPTQKCTSKQVAAGSKAGNSYWLGSIEPRSIETTESNYELR